MHVPDSDKLKEDGLLCLILDYEKLLVNIIPQAMVYVFEDTTNLLRIQEQHNLHLSKSLKRPILI